MDVIPLTLPFYLKWPTWLHFLWWGDQVRYEFFQDPRCNALLTVETMFPVFSQWQLVEEIPISRINNPDWIGSDNFFSELMQERYRCNEALAKLSPFFHRENYNILVHYQRWLSRFARKALEQQIKQLMAYVQKKAKSITLDQIRTAQKECERLVAQLETRNQIWHADLFLELASLRLIIAQFAMRSATSIEQVVSSSFEDKPLFDRLYAELYHVIYQYEENHMPLSTPLQITIQDLKIF